MKKKIRVIDYSLLIMYVCIFFGIAGLFMLVFGARTTTNSYINYLSIYGILFSGIVIAFLATQIGENIRKITITDERIFIKTVKNFVSKTIEISKNDIKSCEMKIYTDEAIKGATIKIILIFSLNNEKTITINHKGATTIIAEKISRLSEYINGFSYNLYAGTTPKLKKTLEDIMGKNKKAIIQEYIFLHVVAVALLIVSLFILLGAYLDM